MSTPRFNRRAHLIANLKWWSGWALDEDQVELHELLMDAADFLRETR